jgi:hypothetical protein
MTDGNSAISAALGSEWVLLPNTTAGFEFRVDPAHTNLLRRADMMDGILLQTIEGLGDGPLNPTGGPVWERLQGEKEEISEELLSAGPLCQIPVSGVKEAEASVECGATLAGTIAVIMGTAKYLCV